MYSLLYIYFPLHCIWLLLLFIDYYNLLVFIVIHLRWFHCEPDIVTHSIALVTFPTCLPHYYILVPAPIIAPPCHFLAICYCIVHSLLCVCVHVPMHYYYCCPYIIKHCIIETFFHIAPAITANIRHSQQTTLLVVVPLLDKRNILFNINDIIHYLSLTPLPLTVLIVNVYIPTPIVVFYTLLCCVLQALPIC